MIAKYLVNENISPFVNHFILKNPRALDTYLHANQMKMYTWDKTVNFSQLLFAAFVLLNNVIGAIMNIPRRCDRSQCVGHVRESNKAPFSCTVRKNMFLPIISSCSNLVGCQCERKLCRYALKRREGIWMQRHAWRMRPKRTVTYMWFDLALKCFSHWLFC